VGINLKLLLPVLADIMQCHKLMDTPIKIIALIIALLVVGILVWVNVQVVPAHAPKDVQGTVPGAVKILVLAAVPDVAVHVRMVVVVVAVVADVPTHARLDVLRVMHVAEHVVDVKVDVEEVVVVVQAVAKARAPERVRVIYNQCQYQTYSE
jgi:hypothetical protein